MQNQNFVGTEHIFMSILKDKNCFGVKFLLQLNLDTDQVFQNIRTILGYTIDPDFEKQVNRSQKVGKVKTPLTDKYSCDLTEMARLNKLDPIIGRDNEIKQLMQIFHFSILITLQIFTQIC